jgi:hypothetical protein
MTTPDTSKTMALEARVDALVTRLAAAEADIATLKGQMAALHAVASSNETFSVSTWTEVHTAILGDRQRLNDFKAAAG